MRHSNGTTEQIDAAYVVSSNGGHSTLRHLLGIKLQGSFAGERFLLGGVDSIHRLDNTSGYKFFSPNGPVVTTPMQGGRVRFLAQIDQQGPLDRHPTQQQLQKILDARVGASASPRHTG